MLRYLANFLVEKNISLTDLIFYIINFFSQVFLKNIDKEKKHTTKQVAKILKYYDFNSIDEFIRPYDNLDRYKQNTSIFSYYFVKGALLNSCPKNIEFIFLKKELINYNFMLELSLGYEYKELIDEQMKMKKKDNSKSMKMTVIS